MKVKIYEFVYSTTVDGNLETKTRLFSSREAAKQHFDEQVELDLKEIKDIAARYDGKVLTLSDRKFDEEIDDYDYVYNREEDYYESYRFGEAIDTCVWMFIAEHELEVNV